MTANYTDKGIDLEIHDTATLTSLIWLRERVQSHIDAMTPTLAETIQAGPLQVVESEPEWSEWYDWSGGANPVGGCIIEYTWNDTDYHGNAYWLNFELITRYRVLLSSIPKGWCLIGGYLVEDLPSEPTEREKLVDALDAADKAKEKAYDAWYQADNALYDFDDKHGGEA